MIKNLQIPPVTTPRYRAPLFSSQVPGLRSRQGVLGHISCRCKSRPALQLMEIFNARARLLDLAETLVVHFEEEENQTLKLYTLCFVFPLASKLKLYRQHCTPRIRTLCPSAKHQANQGASSACCILYVLGQVIMYSTLSAQPNKRPA